MTYQPYRKATTDLIVFVKVIRVQDCVNSTIWTTYSKTKHWRIWDHWTWCDTDVKLFLWSNLASAEFYECWICHLSFSRPFTPVRIDLVCSWSHLNILLIKHVRGSVMKNKHVLTPNFYTYFLYTYFTYCQAWLTLVKTTTCYWSGSRFYTNII